MVVVVLEPSGLVVVAEVVLVPSGLVVVGGGGVGIGDGTIDCN